MITKESNTQKERPYIYSTVALELHPLRVRESQISILLSGHATWRGFSEIWNCPTLDGAQTDLVERASRVCRAMFRNLLSATYLRTDEGDHHRLQSAS